MENLLKKYKDLPNEEYGALIKMIWDYLDYKKAECSNKQIKILFYSQIKKDLDKIIKERNRKRGNKNGR